MTQRSQPAQDHVTNFPTSDAGPYSADEWSDMFFSLFSAGVADQGPLVRYLNELEVTDDALDIDVDTGGAMVDGHWFKNDASEAFTIPHPAANPRIDRVVVAVNNTAVVFATSDLGFTLDFPDNLVDYNLTNSIEPYSARLCIVQGAEAVGPVAPGLDQNNNHFMIPLYQYQISVAGAITAGVDQREFCIFADGPQTKTIFVPAYAGWNQTDGVGTNRHLEATGHYIGVLMLDNKDVRTGVVFGVPDDFLSDMTVTFVFIPLANGDLYAGYDATYGACGEAFNTHVVGNTGAPVAIAVVDGTDYNCINELALVGVARGDIVNAKLRRRADNALDTINANVFFQGVFVEYKSRYS